jgi:hypothetical protein
MVAHTIDGAYHTGVLTLAMGGTGAGSLAAAGIAPLASPTFTGTVTLPLTTIVPDEGKIGFATGAYLTFWDTDHFLEITAAGTGVGIIPTQKFEVFGKVKVSGVSGGLMFADRAAEANTWEWYSNSNVVSLRGSLLSSDVLQIDIYGNVVANVGLITNNYFYVKNGVSEPSANASYAVIYVDIADGDLKVKFTNGTVKTLATN